MNKRGVDYEITKVSFNHDMIYLNEKKPQTFFSSESKHSQVIEPLIGKKNKESKSARMCWSGW